MPFHKPILILILFVTVSQLVAVTEPQNIPPAIVRELEQNGINVSEALELANKLGLDLSNPQMAALRARQAGIPEGKIQELLKIAAELKDQNQPSSTGLPHTTVRDFWGADSLLLESARVGNAAYHQLAGAEPPSPYFGYDLFRNIPRNFEFSPVGPVDDSYIVGFGDDLRLTVWGAAEFQYDLQVDREGRIYIPNVGQFTTAGKPLKQARSDLKRWLSRTYNGLRSTPPTIFMDLTLTRLRPIKIFVLGEVAQPGGYTVTNSSTVFNAIYSVGGPLESGSLREIKVIRNGKVITTVDLYDFLLSGLKHSQVRLTDNDHVFIPLRGKTVTLSGQVKRPSIYELKPDEPLNDLLGFGGGLTPEAYTKRIQIQRIIPFDQRQDPSIARQVLDFDLEPILSGKRHEKMFDGDTVTVFSILDMFKNVATIKGAVLQPGQYEINSEIRTIRDLIAIADGLAGDAYLGKADLVRLKDDSTRVITNINLQEVLEGNPEHNLSLERDDQVRVYSIDELRINKVVTILGAVNKPGNYPLLEDMTVEDLIYQAGGLSEGAYYKEAQISRLSANQNPSGDKSEIVPVRLVNEEGKEFNLDFIGNGQARQTKLKHRDILYIRHDPAFQPQENVSIAGEVRFPGDYPLLRENEMLSEIIERAGGVLPTGYAGGGRLERGGERVVIKMEDAIAGKKQADVILLPDDQIIIPLKPNTVAVRGNVGIEGLIKFGPGKRVSYYIDRAGGLGEDTESVFITQASGATIRLQRNILFRRANPVADEGALITVTKKTVRETDQPVDIRQIVAESTALITSVLTVLILVRNLP